MKPEEQRIAIVTACPYVFVRPVGQDGWNYHNSTVGRIMPCIDGDPLKDLNACHEMLTTLDKEGQVEFCLRLMEVVRRGKSVGTGVRQWDETNATAPQRCEAFLRTIRKWKE